MTRTFIRQLHEWIEANRYKVSCAAIAVINCRKRSCSYRP
jgi:hypothetical protein